MTWRTLASALLLSQTLCALVIVIDVCLPLNAIIVIPVSIDSQAFVVGHTLCKPSFRLYYYESSPNRGPCFKRSLWSTFVSVSLLEWEQSWNANLERRYKTLLSYRSTINIRSINQCDNQPRIRQYKDTLAYFCSYYVTYLIRREQASSGKNRDQSGVFKIEGFQAHQ